MNGDPFSKSRAFYLETWTNAEALLRVIDHYVKQGRMDDPTPDDGWFAYLDGERVHFGQLNLLLDGWTPETLQGSEWVGHAMADETAPDKRAATADWNNRMKQVNRSQAGAKNLAHQNVARDQDVNERRDMLRQFIRPNDSASTLRKRVERETGDVLSVTDKTIQRDMKIIRSFEN